MNNMNETSFLFVGILIGAVVMSFLIIAGIEARGDAFKQETLNEVCHKLYGDDTYFVSRDSLVESSFTCKKDITINKNIEVVRLE